MHKIGVPRLPEPGPSYSLDWTTDFIRILTNWMHRITTRTKEEANAESIATVTASTVMGTGDGVMLVNSSGGGAITITLPDPSTAVGLEYTVKRLNAGGGSITIVSPSGNIDNSASKTLTSIYSTIRVKTDGTNYWIMSSF